MQNLATTINLALQRGDKTIVIEKNVYKTARAFVVIENCEGVTLDFSDSTVVSDGCFLLLRKCKDVVVRNLTVESSGRSEFGCRILLSQATLEHCIFRCDTGGVMVSGNSTVLLKIVTFGQGKGNGVLVVGDNTVEVVGCNFEELVGDAVTVVDNCMGAVSLRENSFKRCAYAVVSLGKNGIRATNNYFLTYKAAILVKESPAKQGEGAFKVEAEYNLFDECASEGGKATVEIAGAQDKGFLHKEIKLCNNIFSQKKRPVLDADGVAFLLFKDNRVKTDDESTVVNSVINGIRA